MDYTARSRLAPRHMCIPLLPSVTFGFTDGERRRDFYNSVASRQGGAVVPLHMLALQISIKSGGLQATPDPARI